MVRIDASDQLDSCQPSGVGARRNLTRQPFIASLNYHIDLEGPIDDDDSRFLVCFSTFPNAQRFRHMSRFVISHLDSPIQTQS